MIIIYQIGSFPLYFSLVGLESKGVPIKKDWSWDSPFITYTGMEGGVSLLPPTSPILESAEISVSGSLVNVPDIKVEAALNYLKSMGGRRNVQVIGAQIAEESFDDEGFVLAPSDITWLVCDAVINQAKVSEVWGGDKSTTSNLPITIDMTLMGYWKSLSPLYWEYQDRGIMGTNPQAEDAQPHMGDTNFIHPTKFEEILVGYVFFRWPSTLSDMSPTMWATKYIDHLGGIGSDFQPFGIVNLFVDPQAWQNVDTLTAFTGLVPTETLSIVVTKPTGPFNEDVIEETSTLDLETTDEDLAKLGHGGLRETDILYTGLVDPLPGYVFRDGEIIEGMSLRWLYPGSYPGEAINGNVSVEYAGSLGAVAYLHDYLVY